MKLTKQRLEKIIKEELSSVLNEITPAEQAEWAEMKAGSASPAIARGEVLRGGDPAWDLEPGGLWVIELAAETEQRQKYLQPNGSWGPLGTRGRSNVIGATVFGSEREANAALLLVRRKSPDVIPRHPQLKFFSDDALKSPAARKVAAEYKWDRFAGYGTGDEGDTSAPRAARSRLRRVSRRR